MSACFCESIISQEVQSCYFQSYNFFLTFSAHHFQYLQYPDIKFKKNWGSPFTDLLRPLSTSFFWTFYIGDIRENLVKNIHILGIYCHIDQTRPTDISYLFKWTHTDTHTVQENYIKLKRKEERNTKMKIQK